MGSKVSLEELLYSPHDKVTDFLQIPDELYAEELAKLGYSEDNFERIFRPRASLEEKIGAVVFNPLPPSSHMRTALVTHLDAIIRMRRIQWPMPFKQHIRDILIVSDRQDIDHSNTLQVTALAYAFFLWRNGYSKVGLALVLDCFGILEGPGKILLRHEPGSIVPTTDMLADSLHSFLSDPVTRLPDCAHRTGIIIDTVQANVRFALRYPELFYGAERFDSYLSQK